MEAFLKGIILAVACIGHTACQECFIFKMLATLPPSESKLVKQNIGINNVLECARICTLAYSCAFLQYCRNEGMCTLYETDANGTTVFESCSNGNLPITVSLIQSATCVVSQTPSGCDVNKYLVTGPDGVADSQLSESSFYSPEIKATSARLTSTGEHGCWAPASQTTSEYIQVDFLTTRLTTAIVLTSRANRYIPETYQYVTAFKVLYSLDCGNFTHVQYGNGTDKIFVGCSYEEEVVARWFEQPIPARCIRINPTAWAKYPSLRFDVLGC